MFLLILLLLVHEYLELYVLIVQLMVEHDKNQELFKIKLFIFEEKFNSITDLNERQLFQHDVFQYH